MSALSQDLHERLRGRFNSLTMGRDDGAKTLVPDEAVFFEFGFKEGANDYGSVVVSILDEGSLKVYFKNDIVEEADEAAKDKWYDFLKDLRFFSAQNMLNYETKNVTKSRLDKADFDFLVGQSNAKDNVAMESKLYGSSQRSYADLNGAKLIVQHNRAVDEEKMGSRSRDIRAIYIENSLGERFRFENNYLPGARAMARHISNGGYQNDEYGEHISEIMAEMSELKSFVRGVKRDDYVTEDSQEIIDLATDRYYGLKSTLESISKQKGYVDYFENYEPQEIEVDENDIDDLRTKLTREVFDDRLESSLGAVGRAMKLSEKKQGEFFDFGKWSRSAKSAGAEIEGDVTGARAMKDGVEIGSWSQDAEDLESPKERGSDIKEPGYGEINMGGGDRGEGDARTFELPASLELMPGTPSWKGMQFTDKNSMLAGILRDIADRAKDDEVSVFAADMATKVSSEGQSFGVRMSDEGYKDNKKMAVKLANMAIKQAQNESVEEGSGSAFGGTIDKMQYIVDTKSAMEIDGVLVDTFTASLIMDIFNKVNKDNQDKMRKMPVEKLASAAYKLADRFKEEVDEDEEVEESADPYMAEYEQSMNDIVEKKEAKPDYLDFDGDGDKDEPMKKALKDKKNKKVKESVLKSIQEAKELDTGAQIEAYKKAIAQLEQLEPRWRHNIDWDVDEPYDIGWVPDELGNPKLIKIPIGVNKPGSPNNQELDIGVNKPGSPNNQELDIGVNKPGSPNNQELDIGVNKPGSPNNQELDIGVNKPGSPNNQELDIGAGPKIPAYPDLDSMSFGKAFAAARKAHGGAGGVFNWKGKEYQTNIKGEKYVTKPTPVKFEAEEVDEGRMSDIDLHIREMIADGASDEEIMAMHPGLVSKQQLKSMRAEEMDRPGEYDESIDWLKKAAGVGSNTKSNFGIREGEQGYQKSLRDEIGKYLEGLK